MVSVILFCFNNWGKWDKITQQLVISLVYFFKDSYPVILT